MIELRRTTAADAQTLVRLRQRCWDAAYRGIYPDSEIDGFDFERHIQMEKKRQENPDFYCFLVTEGESPVGYFSYGPTKDGNFRLHSLYLLPCAQKKGLGRRIFDQVRESCLAMGFREMQLSCNAHNHNALSFYRHLGGKITCTDAGYVNPQEDSCVLEFTFT